MAPVCGAGVRTVRNAVLSNEYISHRLKCLIWSLVGLFPVYILVCVYEGARTHMCTLYINKCMSYLYIFMCYPQNPIQ